MANYVDSKIIINKSVLKQLEKSAIRALEITGDEVLGQIIEAQVVPMDVGTLQESGYVNTDESNSGSVKIVFSTPYARRLYFHPEYNFRTDNNPNAKGYIKDSNVSGYFNGTTPTLIIMYSSYDHSNYDKNVVILSNIVLQDLSSGDDEEEGWEE